MLESFRLPFFASTMILVLFIKMNIKLFIIEVRKLFDYQAYMFTNRILNRIDLKKMLEREQAVKRGHDYSDELSKRFCSKVR